MISSFVAAAFRAFSRCAELGPFSWVLLSAKDGHGSQGLGNIKSHSQSSHTWCKYPIYGGRKSRYSVNKKVEMCSLAVLNWKSKTYAEPAFCSLKLAILTGRMNATRKAPSIDCSRDENRFASSCRSKLYSPDRRMHVPTCCSSQAHCQ